MTTNLINALNGNPIPPSEQVISPEGALSDLRPHPAAELFPMLDDAELRSLADDIQAHGQAMPVILWKGMIMDGRNRMRACKMVGIVPKLTEMTFADDTEAFYFVISTNYNRRHLNESQRGMIAAEIANLGEGRPAKDTAHNCAVSPAISQASAAKLMKVSRRTVQAAKEIHDHAPELAEKVKAGKMKIGAASKVLRERRSEAVARVVFEPRPTPPADASSNNGPVTKGNHAAQKAALDALEAAALELEITLKKWWAAQAACVETGVYSYAHPRRNQKSLAAAMNLLPASFDQKREFSAEDVRDPRIAASVAAWRSAWLTGLVGADALIDSTPKHRTPEHTLTKDQDITEPTACHPARDGLEGDVATSAGQGAYPINGWNGHAFPSNAERVVLPDGRVLEDAVIWPNFLQTELGLDPEQIWADLQAIPTWPSDQPIPFRERGDDPHWIDGKHQALRMRGHALRRSKIWLQSDYADGLLRYGYSGWQHRISFATHAIESVPPVQQLTERLNAGLVRSGHRAHNHFIVTRYENQDHNIGFHSDKDADFAENSFFVVIKFGSSRHFAFCVPGETKPFFSRELSAGTAVFVRCKTPNAANDLVQHGVPLMGEPVGLSGSIVSRCIVSRIPWEVEHREVEKRTG